MKMVTDPLRAPDEALADQATATTLPTSIVWRRIVEQPHQADLFSVLRWLDSHDKTKPLLGRAARPHFEPIRLGQEPSLAFAASTIANVTQAPENAKPRLNIYSFGLFGPNGPLPLHLTEYVRDRLRRVGDSTMVRFADIFHHRLILLFYRAWADAQATVSLDRSDDDRFTKYIASLIGYGQPALRSRDAVPDHAKCFQASHLVRQTRNAEGLANILAEYLGIPVTIDEFIPDWILLAATERTRLSSYRGNNRLGEDAVIGEQVLDAQHKIRIRLGPMPLSRYRSLLPGEPAAKQVMTWIRNYIGVEFTIDIQLVLRKEEITPVQLGHATPLGWTSWLGKDHYEMDADDLVMTDDTYPHQ